MTGERLISFLENPAEMGNVTYQEMKTLTLNYPYSASLRVLLLLKSEQEKHWEKAHNLAMAALYAPDRNRIFCLMSPKMAVLKVAETISAPLEAVLELKPLATAEQEIAARKAAEVELEQKPAPMPGKAAEAPIFFEKNEDVIETKAPHVQPNILVETLPQEMANLKNAAEKTGAKSAQDFSPKPFVFSDWYDQFVLPVLPKKAARISTKIIDNQQITSPQSAPVLVEKTSLAVEKPISKKEEVAHDPEKEREAAVKKLVKRSVKEKEEIASETLAKLYARQGYKEKAVVMYRKLMLVFPEKSATFAAEIEKLGR